MKVLPLLLDRLHKAHGDGDGGLTEQARAEVQRAAVAAGAAGRTPSLLMLMQTTQAGVDVPRVAEAAARNGRGELLKALSDKVDGALAAAEESKAALLATALIGARSLDDVKALLELGAPVLLEIDVAKTSLTVSSQSTE